MSRVLAIDAGTTGVTALVVSDDARIVAKGYREFPQHFPRPGWVEHDADDIWHATLDAVGDALGAARIGAGDLAAIGITNQRETTVLWDRATLEPVHHAIVWQDRRTAERCDAIRAEEPRLRARTGLVLDAYFSATKIEWLLANVDGLRKRAEAGEIVFGTIDTWIVAKLTHGAVHATDYTNASRTLLYDIYAREWSDELLDEGAGAGRRRSPALPRGLLSERLRARLRLAPCARAALRPLRPRGCHGRRIQEPASRKARAFCPRPRRRYPSTRCRPCSR